MIRCANCNAALSRSPSQYFAKGSRRCFCNHACVGAFRRGMTGVNSLRYVHGGKGTRLYRIWKAIKSRCKNPNCTGAHLWLGRGITVCAQWDDSFISFRDWANSNGYSELLQIDRINNDGNYEPSNCRWVTPKENSNNKRTNRLTGKIIAEIMELRNMGKSRRQVAGIFKICLSTVDRAKHLNAATRPEGKKGGWKIEQISA